MQFSRAENIFITVLLVAAILVNGVVLVLETKKVYSVSQPAAAVVVQKNIPVVVGAVEALAPRPHQQKLSNPPEIIKAVYVTGYSAGTKRYLNYLSDLFRTTEINAVVVDIKDYSGLVSYDSDAPDVKKYDLYNRAIPDINALIKFFHDKNIYVIGRIAVFEDPQFSKLRPDLAVYDKVQTAALGPSTAQSDRPVGSLRFLWQDNHGLSWLDPASKDVWDYNISLAKDAIYNGFDEINFDYIRFPSDGKVENMGFPNWDGKISKADVIKGFFTYVRDQLAGEKISADLFGLTTVNTDDMGIGQVMENAFENFDYVSPMVYPSHYANGFIGFENPALHPYEIIKYSLDSALRRENVFRQNLILKNSESFGSPAALLRSLQLTQPNISLAKIRPWLQDFNMGADYTADMIKQEIQATQDSLGSDYNGFMMWNPSNVYTQGAFLPAN